MSYLKWTLSICILAWLGLTSVNRAEDPQFLPRTSVLVLRSGCVLRGDILRVGDRYVVALAGQDEVAVPVESVDLWCDSLDAAYQQKRSRLAPGAKVREHLLLADWCLRYDLMAAAAEQLMAAQRRDPLDPANAHFEKRLRLAAHQPKTTISSRTSTNLAKSESETDELTRSLPDGAVEQFTNTIQPLLINRCGASSCHGPNSESEFQLVFPNWSRTLPRRFTQQNLKMAFEMLDGDHPDRSPLLMMATMAHGGAAKPAVAEEEVTQLRHLVDWAYRSLAQSTATPPSILKVPAPLLMQPMDRHSSVAANPASTSVTPDASTPPASAGPSRDPIVVDPAVQPAAHTSPVSAGTDPFDPEIFNRRFLKPAR